MLLEMEIRLQVAARRNHVVADDSGWWSSRVADPGRPQTRPPDGDTMILTVPRTALGPQGREKTTKALARVTELTAQAMLRNNSVPEHLRTGNRKADAAIADYIAGAAADCAGEFGRSGTFRPSQSDLPVNEREVLFLDLEFFDEAIAEGYGKRITEDDLYQSAETTERQHFDPATSEVAREAGREIAAALGTPANRAPAGTATFADSQHHARPEPGGTDGTEPNTPPGAVERIRQAKAERGNPNPPRAPTPAQEHTGGNGLGQPGESQRR